MNRRYFLKRASAAGIIVGGFPLSTMAHVSDDKVRLTILHTNDVHSRLDPFPAGSGKYDGLGGVAQRATLIEKIREEEDHVLLLDAGDIMQGTPYFNLYKGEVEFKVMNAMQYDVATIGNHDFDAGIEMLAKNTKMADFSLVNCNYNFSDTPMHNLVKPYTIKSFDGVRVGIFGVGIKLAGLVPSEWYGNTQYTQPVAVANRIAQQLKSDEKCDYVICLSHLGYEYRSSNISDVILAQSSRHIDLIVGGHTHTFLDVPDARRNLDGEPVLIAQAGWAGIKLGRLDVEFTHGKKNKTTTPNNQWINDLGQ